MHTHTHTHTRTRTHTHTRTRTHAHTHTHTPSLSLASLQETKPNFVKGGFNKVALLQVSTQTHVLLFDLLNFSGPDVLALLSRLLRDHSVLKIGLGFDHDLSLLRK
jgi:hypothetical protein